MAETKLHGLDELRRKMQQLPANLQRGPIQTALRNSGDVIRDAARANAQRLDDPSTPESIAKNIVTRSSARGYSRSGNLMARIGVLGGAQSPDTDKKKRRRARTGARSLAELGEIAGAGKGNPGGDTFYWRFLEFGTKKMPARPFMRPAMDSGAQPAFNTFTGEMGKALDRALKRLGK